jgi:hypothetical protein
VADRRWAAGKQQIIEGVIDQLEVIFALERHWTKYLQGLLARMADIEPQPTPAGSGSMSSSVVRCAN